MLNFYRFLFKDFKFRPYQYIQHYVNLTWLRLSVRLSHIRTAKPLNHSVQKIENVVIYISF